MKRQENSFRQFIFEFIATEWNELLAATTHHSQSPSMLLEHSFINQLRKVSNNGRNYTQDEINDHIGTMIVAVSFVFVVAVAAAAVADSDAKKLFLVSS